MKITAVLFADAIEPSLPFWVDRMGFAKTIDVPEGNTLGFAILERDGAQIMIQTLDSIRKDEPRFLPNGPGRNAALFIEVADFADVLKRLEGYPIAMPERVAFYGMREIGVVEPNGHVVIFASPVQK